MQQRCLNSYVTDFIIGCWGLLLRHRYSIRVLSPIINVYSCVGLFEWSSGEPYDSQAGHYSNWAGSFMGFNENLDCAVINDLNALLWEEVDCNDEYGFICLKSMYLI